MGPIFFQTESFFNSPGGKEEKSGNPAPETVPIIQGKTGFSWKVQHFDSGMPGNRGEVEARCQP
jgi:hypothetical protein